MSQNKLREEFEAWVQSVRSWSSLMMVNQPGSVLDGEYADPGVRWVWAAWQASRAAVVVELPEIEWMGQVDPEPGLQESKVREVIEAQGLKVAP